MGLRTRTTAATRMRSARRSRTAARARSTSIPRSCCFSSPRIYMALCPHAREECPPPFSAWWTPALAACNTLAKARFSQDVPSAGGCPHKGTVSAASRKRRVRKALQVGRRRRAGLLRHQQTSHSSHQAAPSTRHTQPWAPAPHYRPTCSGSSPIMVL